MHPDLSKNPALWAGLRQTEALRESLNEILNSRTLRRQTTKDWLAGQGVPSYDQLPDEILINHTLNDGFERGFGIHPEVLVRGSNAPADNMVDIGAERSGAGWQDPANFAITSAFVRLLGAAEQFEMDVLKALLYYRPLGLLGTEAERLEQHVEPHVILEQPEPAKDDANKLIFHKPALWTWLRKSAENNIERSRIFKAVFGIKTIPDGYKGKQKEEWYENRNAIAHGRKGVKMSLRDYIDVDVFVAKSMIHVSEQCRRELKLIV